MRLHSCSLPERLRVKNRPDMVDADWILLSVIDDGVGMRPDQIQRIFDPFYTTKPVGEGTGLGLSETHGIVSGAGGHLEVHSEPGTGTTNVCATLYYSPAALAGDKLGLFFGGSAWVRSTDLGGACPQSVLRLFTGPVAYWKIFDDSLLSLDFFVSPNFFWGTDLNGNDNKTWHSWEFANYSALAVTLKSVNLTLDVHNWYLVSLDVRLKDDVHAKEEGFLIGPMLSLQPFASSETFFVRDLVLYTKYEYWQFVVEPEGTSLDPDSWSEITVGFKVLFDIL